MNNTATHSTTTNTPCPTVRKQIEADLLNFDDLDSDEFV